MWDFLLTASSAITMVSVTAMTKVASPSTTMPPAIPTLTGLPLVFGGPTETGSACGGCAVYCGVAGVTVVIGGGVCVVAAVTVVIGGGVCVGTCVEVGEGDGVEGVIIITGCVVEVGQS